MKSKLLITIFLLFVVEINISSADIDLKIARTTPLSSFYGITANFGQYRGKPGYMIHDGIDYRTRDEKGNTFQPIFPVGGGTYSVHPLDDNGFGKYVRLVDYSNGQRYETRYAHLNNVLVSNGDPANINVQLGISGNTGGLASTGAHLHFGIGAPDVTYINTINPIYAGLKQSRYGKLEIRQNKKDRQLQIMLLAPGPDGTFDNANMCVEDPKPGVPVLAVVEAYHITELLRNYQSNPYKIEFEVEKIGDSSWVKTTKTITFDTMKNIMDNLKECYCFYSPYVTRPFTVNSYHYIKFYPTAGRYKITVKIYACYRDNAGFHLTTPNEIDGSIAERIITVGLNRLDAGFNDYDIPYAWLPSDIANGGIMLASTPGRGGGITTAAYEPSGPLYAFATNNLFSSSIVNVDPDFQKYAIISSRTKNRSDWTISVYDASKRKVDEIKVRNQDWLRYEWGGSKPAGSYTFDVCARDLVKGDISTYESYDNITIDNTRPSANVMMIKNSVSATGETISAQITPDEDLYSIVVNVVKSLDKSIVEENLYSNPSMAKGETALVEWQDAYDNPDGYYYYEIVMIDLAGNTTRMYSPMVSVNKGGGFIPPEKDEPYRPEYPTPPSWDKRPKISDIAIDNAGNKYVLYGQAAKISKYGPGGKEIKTVKSFGGTDLLCPLGVAVSDSGDRLYISDSYNIRVLICDPDLNLIKEIKGREVYLTKGNVSSYTWALFAKWMNSGDAGDGEKTQAYEQYGLPDDLTLSGKNLFVTDSGSHRLLKYDLNGKAEIFSVLKADLRDQARAAYNVSRTFDGQSVDWALFYSNSLNDSIIFDNASCYSMGASDKYWWKEMYLHKNIPGNNNGQLKSPQSSVADPAGNIFVADTGNNRIQKFTPDGAFVSKFGFEGTGAGQFESPKGIAIDEDNHVWVADTGNKRIQEFNNNGTYIRTYGNADMLPEPMKLAVKKDGKNKIVYVADGQKDSVQIFGNKPPTDFSLERPGDRFIPYKTFVVRWGTSEAAWYGINRYDIYGRTVDESAGADVLGPWSYVNKDIPPASGHAEISLPGEGVFDIKVRAVDSVENWRDSDGSSSSGDTGDSSRILRAKIDLFPPQPFTLISPNSDGQKFDSKDMKVSWNKANDENLDHYELIVATDPADMHRSAIYYGTFDAEGTQEVLVNNIARGKYYIFMAAHDKAGHWRSLDGKTDVPEYDKDLTYAWKGPWPEFEMGTVPPATFSLTSPYYGQYFDGRDVNIAWSEPFDKDIDHYELCIGTNEGYIRGSAVYSATYEAGTTSAEVHIPGGTYYIYLAACDKDGNWRDLKGKTNVPDLDKESITSWPKIHIDNEAPRIAYDPPAYPALTNPQFSPNGDVTKDSTEVNFKITDDSFYRGFPATMDAKAEIIDGPGSTVKLWDLTGASPGWKKLAWNGTNDSGKTAADGTYKIRITAADKALNTSTDESMAVIIDTTPPKIENALSSGIFSPNGDGRMDTDKLTCEIADALSENIKTSIEVLSQSGATIRALSLIKDTSGVYGAVWDGTDNSGKVAADSQYKYVIKAEDPAGNISTASVPVMVDTRPPYVYDVYTAPSKEAFFTNTSGNLDISFKLSEQSNVALTLYDSNGSALRNYLLSAEADTQNTVRWDGKDSFGGFVPDNTYITYSFLAVDRAENSSIYSPGDIIKIGTPVTSASGNILYSPDGRVKIVVPAGALSGIAELSVEEDNTPLKSYSRNGKDNITPTYRLAARGPSGDPEAVIFKKAPVMTMQYDNKVLNNESQPVEAWMLAEKWEKLYGSAHSGTFNALIEKTGEFSLFADLTPPAAPVIDRPASPTKDRNITVSGSAEPFSKVDLWMNGLKRSPPADSAESGKFTADISLSEGINSISAQAADQDGNIGKMSEPVAVELYTIPPSITLISPRTIYLSPNEGARNEDIISANTDGVSIGITVKNSSGTVLASSDSGSIIVNTAKLKSEGAYTYTIAALDRLGNSSSLQGQIIVDKTIPDAYLQTDPMTYNAAGSIAISGMTDDRNLEHYIVEYGNGESPSSWDKIVDGFIPVAYQKLADFDTNVLADGIYTFRLKVQDKAGNVKTVSLKRKTVNSPIYGNISSPSLNQVIAGTVEVLGSITGTKFSQYSIQCGAGPSPSSWIRIAWSNTMPSSPLLTAWDTTSVPDGQYILRLSAVNAGGNIGNNDVPVTIDNGKPGITIASPASNAVLGGIINIDAGISDPNLAGYKIEYAASVDPANWQTIKDTTNVITSPLAVWDTAKVPDSDYIIRISASDTMGNSSFGTAVISVDNTTPETSIVFPARNQVLNKMIPIAGTASDPHLSGYSLEYGCGNDPAVWTAIATTGAGSYSGILGNWATAGVCADGIYTLRLTAADRAGNTAEARQLIEIDNTPPAVSIAFPAHNSLVYDKFDILGSAADAAHFKEYKLEYAPIDTDSWIQIGNIHSGGATGSTLEALDTTLIPDGSYKLRLTGWDIPGNSSSHEVKVTVDNTYPSVSISYPHSGSPLMGAFNITGTVSDKNLRSSVTEYRQVSSPDSWQLISASDTAGIMNSVICNWQTAGLNGDYIIRVTGIDMTGKRSSAEVSVLVDNIPPAISIDQPSAETVNHGTVKITGKISDENLKEYTIKYGYGIKPEKWWDLASGTTSASGELYSWNTVNVKDGYYTIRTQAADTAGNTSVSEFVMTVDNSPPEAVIHQPVAGQVIRGTVSIEGIACDADFTTYNFRGYELLYGQGASPLTWTTIESLAVTRINEVLSNWNTAPLADGTYTLKLRSKDIGNVTENTRTLIIDNTVPIVSINTPVQAQTVNGNVQVIGSVSDTNIAEYKAYYRQSGAVDWTQTGGGPAGVNNSTLASWNSVNVGDGQYSIRLWAKDGAGNENEVIREVTVNNVLNILNNSVSPPTISPNGDGVDDKAKISYMLSGSTPVTVKIYKKPQYDKFKWEAKATGTYYPWQDFGYTINASGVDHPVQSFNYTLGISGTTYPQQNFSWGINASGIENYSKTIPATQFSFERFVGMTRVVYYGKRSVFTVDSEYTTFTVVPVSGDFTNGNGVYIYNARINPDPLVGPPGIMLFMNNGGVPFGQYTTLPQGDYWADYNGYSTGPVVQEFNVVQQALPLAVNAGASGIQTVYHGSSTDINTSITLPAVHGGSISGQSISNPSGWPDYDDNGYVSTSIIGSSWAGAVWSGTIRAAYNYPGASWSGYSTPAGECASGPNGVRNYQSAYQVKDLVAGTNYLEGINYSLSGLDNGNVYLRFSDGTTSTSNGNQYVVGSTSYSSSWSLASGLINASCNAGPGAPSDYAPSERNRDRISHDWSIADSLSFSLSKTGDPDNRVSLRFAGTGTTTTTNLDDRVIASTSYSEPWDTSLDPGVGNGGWVQSGEIALPFNYDESSQSLNTGYSAPADTGISVWTVNLKAPDGSPASDVALDGTPAASGDFKVKISGTPVKTLQYNTPAAPGNKTIEWDGKDDGGNYVTDGDYVYYIYAGPNVVKKSGVIQVKRSSEITDASISEKYISHNGDGIKDSTAINYSLSETAAVQIDVLDGTSSVIKTMAATGNPGVNTGLWDGTDNSVSPVEDGEYTIRIKAVNSNGAERTRELGVTVDRNSLTAPVIPPVKLTVPGENPVFSPDKARIAFDRDASGKKQIFVMSLSDLQTQQVTTTGNNTQPFWSPDGSLLTFASDRSGINNIWTMKTDGSDQRQVSLNSAAEQSPAFSPDGRKIAYASNRTGYLALNKWNIWTTGIDGKNPSQLTADDTTSRDDHPAWSPDGKKLSYASDRGGSFNIWSVNSDGSSKVQMTSSAESGALPGWSPDGTKLAYTKGGDIYVKDLTATGEARIAAGQNPAWSKDGTEIVYNTAGGEIYSVKVNNGALCAVITQPILDQTVYGLVEVRGSAMDTNFDSYKLEYSPNAVPYGWTALKTSTSPVNSGIIGAWNTADITDGEYVLRLTASDKAGNVLQNSVVARAENNNWKLTLSSLTRITSSAAWNIEPAWSPDCGKIAFTSNRSGNYDIWTMNADGSALLNLTKDPAYDGKPAWSPDGTKIAFVSGRSESKNLWVMNSGGHGSAAQLTSLKVTDTDPSWSPDGSKIAFASNRSGNFNIWTMNSDGTGTASKLTSSEADEKEPNWSQFGITYTSERSGNKQLWMITDVNDPGPFRLTNSSSEDKTPCWSPVPIPLSDGSSRPLIAFTSDRAGNQDIWVTDTDGIDQSKSFTNYTNADCDPAWSPDGRKIAFSSFSENNYDIWVMAFGINTTLLSINTPQTLSLEIPQLESPADAARVTNIRPAFNWKHRKGDSAQYRIDIAKDSAFTAGAQTLIRSAAAGSPDKADSSLYHYIYQIHEFDPGLDKNAYYWKVTALSSADTASSEVRSFTVVPEFSLSGVTNFSNPFNPNKEKTKIRYRLGADADEVAIRIYDITGKLVWEAPSCPAQGEGTSVWDKYHDVEWDGRNGRGDLVMNGIYPFEVSARSGDKTLTARGKIAVLK